ncbi:hypothetical protein AX15_002614 [Amanita polypyramis BW_CC]|nr:hypothetical protein AX15_002614 [Amanita polypyramis BW_CC]
MSPDECTDHRHALDNRTNNPETPTHRQQAKRGSLYLPTPPATRSRVNRTAKRRAGADDTETSKKRARLIKVDHDPFLDSLDSESSTSAYESDSEDEGSINLAKLKAQTKCRANAGVLTTRINTLMNPLVMFDRSLVSTRTILQSYISSHKSDVFKCESTNENTYLTPPYACAYTHSAKIGGSPFLAVSTEQGAVHILNTMKRKDWDPEPQRTTLQPHHNGVFDVKWNMTDTVLATCSADQSTRITLLERQSTIHVLRGHTSTVKCVAWDPNHHDLLATGGRDGSICFWDLRVGKRRKLDGGEDQHTACEPVVTIKGAHEAAYVNGRKLKAKRGKRDPLPRTITSLLYPGSEPYGLVSSGAFDGILRYWDLRQPTSKRSKPAKPKTPTCLYSTVQDPTTRNGSRPRGIISLASGHGPTAGVLFGLGADSYVHTYTLPRLEAQESVKFVHEHLQSSSFYVGLSVSPCGQWLASGGGTGVKGSAFLFDVANAARPWREQSGSLKGVELKGQLGEVGAVDWGHDMLATCADDGTVRVWRPDTEVRTRCATEPEESKWDWSWASA